MSSLQESINEKNSEHRIYFDLNLTFFGNEINANNNLSYPQREKDENDQDENSFLFINSSSIGFNEEDDKLYYQLEKQNKSNKPKLSSNDNKAFFEEIKTNEVSKFKPEEKKRINNKNVEPTLPAIYEVIRKYRDDNDKIKIKRKVFELFKEMLNKNIKDDNLKINEFDQNKVKDINIKENRLLGKKKWKDIILNNSNGNEEIINKIYYSKKKILVNY